MPNVWVRTCQSCGHRQQMKEPTNQKTDGWMSALCRKCKSPDLDYGSTGWELVDGKLTRTPSDE